MKLRQLAVIVSTIALTMLLWSPNGMTAGETTQRDRIFILSAEVGPGMSLSERDLLARIRQELPMDLFNRYHVEYEDLFGYLEIQKWNPDKKLDVFQWEFIQQVLSAKQMKWMLTFSISLTPAGPSDGRLLLSGRLYDLDAMMCLLLEAKAQPGSQLSLRKKCKSQSHPWDASKEASIDLKSFDDLRSGLKTLFEKLFSIPEIEFKTNETYFDIVDSHKIGFHLRLNRTDFPDKWTYSLDSNKNDNRLNSDMSGSAPAFTPFGLQVGLMKLQNNDLDNCSNLDKISNYLKHTSEKNREPDTRIKKIWVSVDGINERTKAADGGGYIQLNPTMANVSYLLEARFLTQARGRDGKYQVIPSFYRYKCIHAREPLNLFVVESGLNLYSSGILSDRSPVHERSTFPGAAVAIGIKRMLWATGNPRFLPSFHGSLLLSYSTINHGKALNCNDANTNSCDNETTFSAASNHLYVQGRFSSVAYRTLVSNLRIEIPISLGFGLGAAMHELYIGEETRSMWSFVFAENVGIGLKINNATGLGAELTASYELFGNNNTKTLGPDYINDALLYHTIWLRFTVELAIFAQRSR